MHIAPFPHLLLAHIAALAAGSMLPGHGPNLLQNPSFETRSLAPWTLVAGSVGKSPYGSASLPGTAVGNATGGGCFALLDKVSARLMPTTTLLPVPLGVNLLPSASFENGSLPGSPLELNSVPGWFGASSGRVTVPQYGTPSMPSSTFALQNGLGNLLLQDGTNSVLRADIDLRGGAQAIASGLLAMQASAWLGGQGAQADTAEVRIRFQTIAGVPTGAVTILPPVTAAERQNLTRRISV